MNRLRVTTKRGTTEFQFAEKENLGKFLETIINTRKRKKCGAICIEMKMGEDNEEDI